jgi:hypothetical protein
MQLLFLFFCSIPVVYFGLKRFDFDFVENGILPRTLSGLQGVFLVRLFMLIWSIFITIQSFTYFIALQFFLPRSNREGDLIDFIFRIDYLIIAEAITTGASGLIYVLFSFVFFLKAYKLNTIDL